MKSRWPERGRKSLGRGGWRTMLKMATRTARWLCEQHDRRACEGTMPTKSLPKTQKGCRESRSKQISSLCGIMKNQEACWEQITQSWNSHGNLLGASDRTKQGEPSLIDRHLVTSQNLINDKPKANRSQKPKKQKSQKPKSQKTKSPKPEKQKNTKKNTPSLYNPYHLFTFEPE